MCAQLLVVEDNEANLALMAYLLRSKGHTVETAGDGEEALDAVAAKRPDLIVCDIQIPILDGFGVAQSLKSNPGFRRIPLIAVTAFAMVGDRDYVLSRGFDGYISKPIAPETFVQEVEALLPSQLTGARASEAQHRTEEVVLVVDDVHQNVEFVRSALAPLGYSIVEAATVSDAVDRACEQTPNLILSDFHLGREKAVDLIKACRVVPKLRATPIVVMSNTFFVKEDRERSLKHGALDFIERPIGARELVNKVEEYLSAA